MAFPHTGIAYALEAFRVPVASRTARGVLLQQLLPIDPDDSIAELLPINDFSDDTFLVLLTRHGWIKKTPLRAFERITARGLIAVSLGEADTLTHAGVCTEEDSVILCSRMGQALRFHADSKNLRASGRASRGVKSIALRPGDEIADMDIVRQRKELDTRVRVGLYKIFVYLFLFVQESIIPVLPPPIRITNTTAIRLRDFCAVYILPPALPLYAIHHTILVMTISCNG